jgi:hypothetical protein
MPEEAQQKVEDAYYDMKEESEDDEQDHQRGGNPNPRTNI